MLLREAARHDVSEAKVGKRFEASQLGSEGDVVGYRSQYFAHRKYLVACQSAHYLHKCLEKRLWEESRYCARQLKGVGVKLSTQLVTAGLDSLQKLEAADPRQLERILGKPYPAGNALLTEVHRLPPCVTLSLEELQSARVRDTGDVEVHFKLVVERHDAHCAPRSADRANMFAQLLVGDSSNVLTHNERIATHSFASPHTVHFAIRTSRQQKARVTVLAYLVRASPAEPCSLSCCRPLPVSLILVHTCATDNATPWADDCGQVCTDVRSASPPRISAFVSRC
jgi:hypothetical protein